MKPHRKIAIALAVVGIVVAGVVWFNYGRIPGYEHLSPRDLLGIRQAIRRQTPSQLSELPRTDMELFG